MKKIHVGAAFYISSATKKDVRMVPMITWLMWNSVSEKGC